MQVFSERQKRVHERAVAMGAEFVTKEKELIEVFIEVSAHEVFRAVGCASLYEYALKHVYLTPDQAYTYTKIAQASQKCADLREAVREKEINITNAKLVATLFSNKQVKLDQEKKSEILQKAKECSVRELRRELAEAFPQAGLREEKVREVAGNRVSLDFSVDVDAMERFRRVQDLESNKKRRNVSVEEAFNEAILFYIEKCDPVKKAKRAEERQRGKSAASPKNNVSPKGDLGHELGKEPQETADEAVVAQPQSVHAEGERVDERDLVVAQQEPQLINSEPVVSRRPRLQLPSIISITPEGVYEFEPRPDRQPIPTATIHKLSIRDGGKCQHILNNGVICQSRRFVEVHHRVPVEKGGSNRLDNLITLCRSHHKLLHFS